MKSLLLTLLISTSLPGWISSLYAQCNGNQNLCDKRYDEVAYLTTHNAFNSGSEGFLLPNQNFGIAQQLNDGVRAFMLDVYNFFGTPTVYHGTFVLGSQPLQEDLGEIKTFLDNNLNEVVTIILECYVSASDIESELIDAGLFSYLYAKPIGQDWATLQEMIDNNTRLIVFSDQNDAAPGQEWYHYMWDNMVETHYTVNDPSEFTNDYNRGDSLNDLFIFNHFVTDALLGTGQESQSVIVNEYGFLFNRISAHYNDYSKFPNFITLDFYDQGDGLVVVDAINNGLLEILPTDNALAGHVTLFPNPASGKILVQLDGKSTLNLMISIYNGSGRNCLTYSSLVEDQCEIDISSLDPGLYTVLIQDDLLNYHIQKLVIQ